jgi:8-oxo-dGTP diphosphatase
MRERSSQTPAVTGRSAVAARPVIRRALLSVDVVLFTPHGRRLTVLLVRASDARARERWELPWDAARSDEPLDTAAARIARSALGAGAAWTRQVMASGSELRHPGETEFSIAYVGLVASGTPPPVGGEASWFPLDEIPSMAPRHRAMIDSALAMLRLELDQSPVAFKMLPATFTLSQLQEVYEVLLGRRLHKASFRRALHAAWLVEPIDEWRSEGRGRPAQLFRYAPKKRRGGRRGVRFDLLG